MTRAPAPLTPFEAVLISRDGSVTTISLNRPERLNAFNGPLRSAMLAALTEDDLIQVATALAARLAELPTQALALMKQAFDASATNSLGRQLALECELQAKLGHAADFAEGRRAFLEKRSPRFNAS